MDAKDSNGVFRTIDGASLRWTDRNGVVHAVEGAEVHRGVRLLWTICEHDVPADTAFKSAEVVTCERCQSHEPHGALDTYRGERMRAKGASSEAAEEGSGGAANAARPSCRGDASPFVMAYECVAVVNALVMALRPHLGTGEFIIFRDAFRWKRDNGNLDGHQHRGDVISNGYEMFEADSIAELCEAETVWDFRHVAVLAPKSVRA